MNSAVNVPATDMDFMNGSVNSLYIPTIKISWTEDAIKEYLWLHNVGLVTRVDFAPILYTGLNKEEQKENTKFRQAFVHLRGTYSMTESIMHQIETAGSYRLYPFSCYNFIGQTEAEKKEYWILLKNKEPVPEATTTLNIHQLVHNNTLLEAKLAQMEKEMEELKQKNSELEAENANLRSNVEELKNNPDNDLNSDVAEFFANQKNEKRYCCECHNVELTGYYDIVCPSCLNGNVHTSYQTTCYKCHEVELNDGNYICQSCFESTEVSGDFIPDNNSEDLDSGERSPRGYDIEDSDNEFFEDAVFYNEVSVDDIV
jgi:FtsZ-binding cell division protein ZapB